MHLVCYKTTTVNLQICIIKVTHFVISFLRFETKFNTSIQLNNIKYKIVYFLTRRAV